MVTRSILKPKNLNNLKRHFEREFTKNQKKLNSLNKSRREIEIEIETLKDGIEWCESIYKVSKSS